MTGWDVDELIAHSKNDAGKEHGLKQHLLGTAEIATAFARNDVERDICNTIGILHDAGKYQRAFQEYLRNGGRRGSVPHAAIGAALSRPYSSTILPFCIEGHHKGLADTEDLKGNIREYANHKILKEVEGAYISQMGSYLKAKVNNDAKIAYKGFEFEFFIRYIFSILTDADWIDTEKHFTPERAEIRKSTTLDLSPMLATIEDHFKNMSKDGDINLLRNQVRDYAAAKAALPVGFFSLNLPTGMGKTLTSFYWALKHAQNNNLKRIIIVLPFINIIDQTAKALKDIFGEEVVLEHHSGVRDEEKDDDRDYNRKKLAAENWDYPVIVTTTVQFFESLFSNRTSHCRKIHNIADSVVIFDEVQSLPKHLVQPTITMLKNVSKVAGTSFLFCTATQPAFLKRERFDGVEHIEPLVESPAIIFKKTRRVTYSLIDNLDPITEERLLQNVVSRDHSALVIFNTKKETLSFYNQLRSCEHFGQLYHLSTSMCAHHRRSVIDSIRNDLKRNVKIAVCSTQLIEAGVDFDFPRVFRALAPLESIIQAAGRCNREGKMKSLGDVSIFQLENAGYPTGDAYKTCAQFAKRMILDNVNLLEQHDSYEEYYKQVVELFIDPDKRKIDEARTMPFKFKTVAEAYRIIESPTTELLISGYNDEAKQYVDNIRHKPYVSRDDRRLMQPYLVQVFPDFLKKHAEQIEQLENDVRVWAGGYDMNTGIVADFLQVDKLIL